MKTLLTVAGVTAIIALAPVANANGPIPVVDEAASICGSLSLIDSGYSDWGNIQISLLQTMYDASRGEAVAAIKSAAVSYCPEYLSSVPVR